MGVRMFECGRHVFSFNREEKQGICHESIQDEDHVVILDGWNFLCILRRTPQPENMFRSERDMQGPKYKFVVNCSLEDYMHGEIFSRSHFRDPLLCI